MHKNALLTSSHLCMASITMKFPYSITLIDFGHVTDAVKCEFISNPGSNKEVKVFQKMIPHLPESVCLVKQPLSRASDMYSNGKFIVGLKNNLNFQIGFLEDIITSCSICFPKQGS